MKIYSCTIFQTYTRIRHSFIYSSHSQGRKPLSITSSFRNSIIQIKRFCESVRSDLMPCRMESVYELFERL